LVYPSYPAGKDNGLGEPMNFLTNPLIRGISGEVDFIAGGPQCRPFQRENGEKRT
jgi:hypothetical protein